MKKFNTVDLVLFTDNLNDQIGEIHVNRRLSREDKQKALIELGLKKDDLRILFNGIYFNPKAPIRVVTPKGHTFTFGTEIECFVPHDRIVETATANGVSIMYEHYNHTDGKRHYKFVSDGSVHSSNYEENQNSIECVSPVLKGARGLTSLKKACKALNEAGATVNKTCGLHVHVGAAELNGEQYVNVFKNYQMLETLIDSFMAYSRRADHAYYAQTLRGYDFSDCHSVNDVNAIMYGRYWKVNPQSYSRHKTIEFRQHQGSTNYDKISMWVNFCTKLVEWSMDNVLTTVPASIADIPFLSDKEKTFFSKRAAEMARNND